MTAADGSIAPTGPNGLAGRGPRSFARDDGAPPPHQRVADEPADVDAAARAVGVDGGQVGEAGVRDGEGDQPGPDQRQGDRERGLRLAQLQPGVDDDRDEDHVTDGVGERDQPVPSTTVAARSEDRRQHEHPAAHQQGGRDHQAVEDGPHPAGERRCGSAAGTSRAAAARGGMPRYPTSASDGNGTSRPRTDSYQVQTAWPSPRTGRPRRVRRQNRRTGPVDGATDRWPPRRRPSARAPGRGSRRAGRRAGITCPGQQEHGPSRTVTSGHRCDQGAALGPAAISGIIR